VDSLHGLSCSLNKGPRNLRHDNIRDKLYQLIKRLNPGIQQTHLSLEFEVGQITSPGDAPKHVRTDIKYIKGADTFLIDIGIVDPAASAFQRASTYSHVNLDGAACQYEQTKRQHYARVNTPQSLLPRSVIPFIIEATGRLGPSALLFLHSLCVTQTYSHSIFISEINLISAHTAGRMLKTTRDPFQGPHQGVLLAPMHG
jgi:hypothetical protein